MSDRNSEDLWMIQARNKVKHLSFIPQNKQIIIIIIIVRSWSRPFMYPAIRSCPQATKFGGNDWVDTPLLPYLLNKVNDPLLPYFHYFFLMFYYNSCLISVLVSLQNYSVFHLVVTLNTGCYAYVDNCYPFNGTRVATNRLLLM